MGFHPVIEESRDADERVVCDENKREKWRKFSVRCITGTFISGSRVHTVNSVLLCCASLLVWLEDLSGTN